jgi:hypothetical protein
MPLAHPCYSSFLVSNLTIGCSYVCRVNFDDYKLSSVWSLSVMCIVYGNKVAVFVFVFITTVSNGHKRCVDSIPKPAHACGL